MKPQNTLAALTIAAPDWPEGELFHGNRQDPPRRYKCPLYSKAFRRLEHQKRYIKPHTREKPHACQFLGCAKRFSRSDKLTWHSRIHNSADSRRSAGGSSYSMESNGSTLLIETGPRTALEYSPGHSLRLRPYDGGYELPTIRNLSSQPTFAFIPMEPKLLDCYGQHHTNSQSLPASSAVKSGLTMIDIISQIDDTQRKLPVPQLPKVILQDCLAALGTGSNASAESDTTESIAGDIIDAMSEAGTQNNMLSKVPNELPPIKEIAPASQYDSGSSNGEDETDWGEDDNCVSEEQIQHFGLADALDKMARSTSQILMKPILNQTQAELVDLLMDEFWAMIKQNPGTNTAAHGNTSSSTSPPSQNTESAPERSSKPKSRARALENEEDGDIGEDDRQGPKRQKLGGSSPTEMNLYACPYRKHDPRKYNVQDWATCALTPHRTVARVKGHLYRYHIIHLCPRCKALFQSSGDLDEHVLAPNSCALSTFPPAEGITTKMKEQLQCRKKTHQGQSEAEPWQQIYQIIFPAEIVPSPYFQPVRDHNDKDHRSPDSRQLTRYEGFLRRELPRYLRNVLETAVHGEVRSTEEHLREDLMNLLDQARNHALSNYRATSDPASEISSHLPAGQIQGENVRPTTPRMDTSGTTMLGAFYQSPPPSILPELPFYLSDFLAEMEPLMNSQIPEITLPVSVQKVHDEGGRPAANSSLPLVHINRFSTSNRRDITPASLKRS